MSASSIRAGRAFVEIAAKDKTAAVLNAAASRVKQWGANLVGFGRRMAAVGAAILGPLLAMTNYFRTTGDSLNDMVARTGMATEALSELGYAAEQTGGSIDDVQSATLQMQKVLTKAPEKLEALGINLAEFRRLAPDKQIEAIADAIARLPTPALRSAAAFSVFRGAAKALLPLLVEGAAGIRAYRDAAREEGRSISKEQADAAGKLDFAWTRAWANLKNLAFQTGAALGPTLTKIADTISIVVAWTVVFVREHQTLVQWVTLGAAAIVAAGTALATLGLLLGGCATALTTLAGVAGAAIAAVTAVGGAIAALVAAVGFFPAAIIAATVAMLAFMVQWSDLWGMAKDVFMSFWNYIVGTFGGLLDALAMGNIGLAWNIVLQGMKVMFLDFIAMIIRGFRNLVTWIDDNVGGAISIITGVKLAKLGADWAGDHVDQWQKDAQKELDKLNVKAKVERQIKAVPRIIGESTSKQAIVAQQIAAPPDVPAANVALRGLERGSLEAFEKSIENRNRPIEKLRDLAEKQLEVQEQMRDALEDQEDAQGV